MASEFNARIIEKVDGIDQRYWDFELDRAIIVLHSDPYAGISIHIENGTKDSLLRKVASTLLNEGK